MPSSATQTSICNLALRAVGAARITSINDSVESARVLNDVYTLIREEVLSAHPWNFALRRASLTQLDETPEFDYDYAYQLPTGCLRVIKMSVDNAEFKIEEDKLLTDETSAKILYITNVTSSADFSPAFVSAFAARLAAEIAYPLTNSQTLADSKYSEYLKKLKTAKSIDGQEGSKEPIEDISWIDDRK